MESWNVQISVHAVDIFIWGPSVADQHARKCVDVSVVRADDEESAYICIFGDAVDDVFIIDFKRLAACNRYRRLVSFFVDIAGLVAMLTDTRLGQSSNIVTYTGQAAGLQFVFPKGFDAGRFYHCDNPTPPVSRSSLSVDELHGLGLAGEEDVTSFYQRSFLSDKAFNSCEFLYEEVSVVTDEDRGAEYLDGSLQENQVLLGALTRSRTTSSMTPWNAPNAYGSNSMSKHISFRIISRSTSFVEGPSIVWASMILALFRHAFRNLCGTVQSNRQRIMEDSYSHQGILHLPTVDLHLVPHPRHSYPYAMTTTTMSFVEDISRYPHSTLRTLIKNLPAYWAHDPEGLGSESTLLTWVDALVVISEVAPRTFGFVICDAVRQNGVLVRRQNGVDFSELISHDFRIDPVERTTMNSFAHLPVPRTRFYIRFNTLLDHLRVHRAFVSAKITTKIVRMDRAAGFEHILKTFPQEEEFNVEGTTAASGATRGQGQPEDTNAFVDDVPSGSFDLTMKLMVATPPISSLRYTMAITIELSTLAAFIALAVAMASYIHTLRRDLAAERRRVAIMPVPADRPRHDDAPSVTASSNIVRVSGKRPGNLYESARQALDDPAKQTRRPLLTPSLASALSLPPPILPFRSPTPAPSTLSSAAGQRRSLTRKPTPGAFSPSNVSSLTMPNGKGKGRESAAAPSPSLRTYSTLSSLSSVPSSAGTVTLAKNRLATLGANSTAEAESLLFRAPSYRGSTPSSVSSQMSKRGKGWVGSEGEDLLDAPPVDPDVLPALGDIHRRKACGHEPPFYQLWLRVAAMDGRHVWTPVMPGYEREDGRWLILTQKRKDPSWVLESHYKSVMRAEQKAGSNLSSISAPPQGAHRCKPPLTLGWSASACLKRFSSTLTVANRIAWRVHLMAIQRIPPFNLNGDSILMAIQYIPPFKFNSDSSLIRANVGNVAFPVGLSLTKQRLEMSQHKSLLFLLTYYEGSCDRIAAPLNFLQERFLTMVLTTIAAFSALILVLQPSMAKARHELQRWQRARRIGATTRGRHGNVNGGNENFCDSNLELGGLAFFRAPAGEVDPRDGAAILRLRPERAPSYVTDMDSAQMVGMVVRTADCPEDLYRDLPRSLAGQQRLVSTADQSHDEPPPYAPPPRPRTRRAALQPVSASAQDSANPLASGSQIPGPSNVQTQLTITLPQLATGQLGIDHGSRRGYFKGFGSRLIDSPPPVDGVDVGDIYLYIAFVDGRLEERLWLCTLNQPGMSPVWKAVQVGYRRADGWRLAITGYLREPVWVAEARFNAMSQV
ncbi:hypothetical protein C8Q80DRAFT_1118245 [Daedaleopsis nitida]|nr:hypothetical protein C8Q80DRAFT_1118245 [Daedaleopsis nitida]